MVTDYKKNLNGFPAATYVEYASPQTLVRPCSTKKWLISGAKTLNERESSQEKVAIL